MRARRGGEGRPAVKATRATTIDLAALAAVERRVLWLAMRMIDYANRERPNPDAVKVGGHQASSASVVSLMTAMYFHWLAAGDRVSVKPHASPVLHSINYLLGRLDREYLTTLRDFGGLQSYPSRTKDPDPVDFSTGSVGLGAAAPLFAGVVDRYLEAHFGLGNGRRFVALIGDAELDEGNVWEAITARGGFARRVLIIDLNRRASTGWSRIRPRSSRVRLAAGTSLTSSTGPVFRRHSRLRRRRCAGGSTRCRTARPRACSVRPQRHPPTLSRALGGRTGRCWRLYRDAHEERLRLLICDSPATTSPTSSTGWRVRNTAEWPTVIFAYTIKGWASRSPDTPSTSPCSTRADRRLARGWPIPPGEQWARFPASESEARRWRRAPARLAPYARSASSVRPVTETLGENTPSRTISTQEAFGRALLDLSATSCRPAYSSRSRPTFRSRRASAAGRAASVCSLPRRADLRQIGRAR